MRRYALLTGLIMMGALITVSTSAQQAATITLRSGETVRGDLVDLGGVGFTVRVNGEQRTIQKSEVAMVDFGTDNPAAPDAARTLSGGTSLIQLNNGDTVQGEFYDISGTTPLQITFRTSTGERTFTSNEVRRIYLTPVTGSTTTSGQTAGGAAGGAVRTVQVLARNPWTPTGVTVTQGQVVRFETTGEVQIAPNATANPAGNSANMYDKGAPIPTALQGALIGRITNGRNVSAPFAIGNQTTVPMPATGQLLLAVNDSSRNDNSGQFTVEIVAP